MTLSKEVQDTTEMGYVPTARDNPAHLCSQNIRTDTLGAIFCAKELPQLEIKHTHRGCFAAMHKSQCRETKALLGSGEGVRVGWQGAKRTQKGFFFWGAGWCGVWCNFAYACVLFRGVRIKESERSY